MMSVIMCVLEQWTEDTALNLSALFHKWKVTFIQCSLYYCINYGKDYPYNPVYILAARFELS